MDRTRREILIWLGSALLGANVGIPLVGAAARTRGRAPDLRESWPLLTSSWTSAAAIGAAYLARFPEDARSEILMRRIRERLPEGRVRGAPCACGSPPPFAFGSLRGRCAALHDLRGAIRHAIASDFESHDTVRLEGWVLSRTECRLCALVALA